MCIVHPLMLLAERLIGSVGRHFSSLVLTVVESSPKQRGWKAGSGIKIRTTHLKEPPGPGKQPPPLL